MRIVQTLAIVLVLAAILALPPVLRAGEADQAYQEFLNRVLAEARAIEQARELERKHTPPPSPPPPPPEQQLLNEAAIKARVRAMDRERVRARAQARAAAAKKAAPTDEELAEKARKLVEAERRRAAGVQAGRLERLLTSAREHIDTGRLAAAAKAIKMALEIDPRNAQAGQLQKRVEAARDATAQTRTEVDLRRETAESHRYIERMRVPQADVVTYPRDWEKRKAETEPAVLAGADAKPDPQVAATRRALEKKISIEAISMSLDEVAAYLRHVAKLNIVLDNDVADKTIDLHMRNVSVETVLRWTTKLSGQAYVVRNGVVHIGPKEKMIQESIIKVYDVSDILRMRRRLSKNLRRRDDGLFEEDSPTTEELAEDLMDFIKIATGRDRWGDDPGDGRMNVRLGRLVVNAEPSLQLKVLNALGKMRE